MKQELQHQPGSFERKSCLLKKRWSIEPSCTLDQYAYPCRFCQGWHKATKKDENNGAA